MGPAISLRLITLSCLLVAAASGTQDDRQKAVSVWEQAIAAKGGRDRLHGILSVAVREKSGIMSQIVCELPNRWWEYDDYRPLPLGYSVRVVNTETGLGWASYDGHPAGAFRRPDRDTAYRLRQLQYVYFLETRWVRASPLRASRVRLGFRRVERVETEIDDDAVVFYLDLTTHLPVRIETSRTFTVKPPRPGAFRDNTVLTSERKYIFKLDGYHEVAGIQVPGRVTLSGHTVQSRVEINPDYEPAIFNQPPPPGAGIDSWRKRADRKYRGRGLR